MANINKIKLSGTTYNIQDLSAAKTVELTQAQYDALVSGGTVDPNTFYVITDAQGADLSQYYTSAQTESAITQAVSGKVDTSTFNTYSGSVDTALSGKQATLVSGTNIKTINNESILGSGNITIEGGGGGGVTVDQSLDSGSTNAISNAAVSAALNKNFYFLYDVSAKQIGGSAYKEADLRYVNPYTSSTAMTRTLSFARINNNGIVGVSSDFSLVETSAITTSIASSSTDSQVPSAKAVYDQLGGLKLVKLSQSEFDNLETKDSNTLYFIGDSTNGYTMKIGSANVN